MAGNGLWLPIVNAKQDRLLELLHIKGAFEDSPEAAAATQGGAEGAGVGGWNPLLSAVSATLSVNRQAVHFAPGSVAVALAETGFEAGWHVTVFRILQMEKQGYVGVSELPALPDAVNHSHLGLFGFAVGGAAATNTTRTRLDAPEPKSPAAGLFGLLLDHKSSKTPKSTPENHSSNSGRTLTASATRATPDSLANTPGASGQEDRKDARGRGMVRVWLQGKLGEFVEGFEEGDEVALVLDMRHQHSRTLDYYVNRHFKARITSQLPPGPMYPAAGCHKLAKKGTSFAAAFNIPFHVSDDRQTISYHFP